jgi:hypothetical protein
MPHAYHRGVLARNIKSHRSFVGAPSGRQNELEITIADALSLAKRITESRTPVCWEHDGAKQVGFVAACWYDHDANELCCDLAIPDEGAGAALNAYIKANKNSAGLSLSHVLDANVPIEVSVCREGAREGTGISGTYSIGNSTNSEQHIPDNSAARLVQASTSPVTAPPSAMNTPPSVPASHPAQGQVPSSSQQSSPSHASPASAQDAPASSSAGVGSTHIQRAEQALGIRFAGLASLSQQVGSTLSKENCETIATEMSGILQRLMEKDKENAALKEENKKARESTEDAKVMWAKALMDRARSDDPDNPISDEDAKRMTSEFVQDPESIKGLSHPFMQKVIQASVRSAEKKRITDAFAKSLIQASHGADAASSLSNALSVSDGQRMLLQVLARVNHDVSSSSSTGQYVLPPSALPDHRVAASSGAYHHQQQQQQQEPAIDPVVKAWMDSGVPYSVAKHMGETDNSRVYETMEAELKKRDTGASNKRSRHD